MNAGRVRIIAGKYKGKCLPVIPHVTLRPTPNRVRETLFNWLMHDIPGSRCLDAFSGSGALGLEALSRGAKQVVLLESDAQVFRQLQQTTATFSSPDCMVIQMDALRYLQHVSEPFDIIFLDPPFHSSLLTECLTLLTTQSCLAANGIVYVESHEPLTDLTEWTCLKHQKAGQVYYALLRR